MTKIIFLPHEEICPEGAMIEAEPGVSICDAALANGIEIEHACEKSCACTTCHVVIREGFAGRSGVGIGREDRGEIELRVANPVSGTGRQAAKPGENEGGNSHQAQFIGKLARIGKRCVGCGGLAVISIRSR